jgi:hypothetical protein
MKELLPSADSPATNKSRALSMEMMMEEEARNLESPAVTLKSDVEAAASPARGADPQGLGLGSAGKAV